METYKPAVAFGGSVPRFGKFSAHPGLDKDGITVPRPQGCDPALYHPRMVGCITSGASTKDPWRAKVELEEWAANLGYRNIKILEQRRYQQSVLGAAWHDVQTPPPYQPACMNVGFGRTRRFKLRVKDIPGPGTYYKEKPFKAPYGPHSTLPSFEWQDACRFKSTVPKWSLAPNRYTIVDPESIERKSHKLVSLRGPYDLFTGKRDSSTIKNRFGSNRVAAATWPLALKGSLTKYNKSHFGTMNKTGRDHPYRGRLALVDISMAIRVPADPGPSTYSPDNPRVFVQNRCGFNSSYDKGPGYIRVVVWPGVGRYSPTTGSCGIPGQGHKHVFLSKVPRTIGADLPQHMNAF